MSSTSLRTLLLTSALALMPVLLGANGTCGGGVVPIGKVDAGGEPGEEAGAGPSDANASSDVLVCGPTSCGPLFARTMEACAGSDEVRPWRCRPGPSGSCEWLPGECPVPVVDAGRPDQGGSSTEGGTGDGCIVTGCSGQICSDRDVASTCEFRAEYACYKFATCRRTELGTCAWEVGPEAAACLQAAADAGRDAPSAPLACRAAEPSVCPAGTFCSFAPADRCGRGGIEGTCEPRPLTCLTLESPVCGCDGRTYANACAAGAAGVPVDYEGSCRATGRICGGLSGGSCGANQYCAFDFAAQCGAADRTGVCTARPEVCTEEFNPVCGCDDVTYDNPCLAARAGVSVASRGACSSVARSCGGILAAPCAADEFCRFDVAEACGAADQLGTCTKREQSCSTTAPAVCGCDGRTYTSACAAAAAGVSYRSEGACR